MLVKVECEGGLYGWGEAGLSGRELAVSGAVDHYKQFLIGQDGMPRRPVARNAAASTSRVAGL